MKAMLELLPDILTSIVSGPRLRRDSGPDPLDIEVVWESDNCWKMFMRYLTRMKYLRAQMLQYAVMATAWLIRRALQERVIYTEPLVEDTGIVLREFLLNLHYCHCWRLLVSHLEFYIEH